MKNDVFWDAASLLSLVTLMMDAMRSCEALVLTRATRRNFPEDAILQSPP
jgi:hypothetical protein